MNFNGSGAYGTISKLTGVPLSEYNDLANLALHGVDVTPYASKIRELLTQAYQPLQNYYQNLQQQQQNPWRTIADTFGRAFQAGYSNPFMPAWGAALGGLGAYGLTRDAERQAREKAAQDLALLKAKEGGSLAKALIPLYKPPSMGNYVNIKTAELAAKQREQLAKENIAARKQISEGKNETALKIAKEKNKASQYKKNYWKAQTDKTRKQIELLNAKIKSLSKKDSGGNDIKNAKVQKSVNKAYLSAIKELQKEADIYAGKEIPLINGPNDFVQWYEKLPLTSSYKKNNLLNYYHNVIKKGLKTLNKTQNPHSIKLNTKEPSPAPTWKDIAARLSKK